MKPKWTDIPPNDPKMNGSKFWMVYKSAAQNPSTIPALVVVHINRPARALNWKTRYSIYYANSVLPAYEISSKNRQYWWLEYNLPEYPKKVKGQCYNNEKRTMEGGCANCGDPCY